MKKVLEVRLNIKDLEDLTKAYNLASYESAAKLQFEQVYTDYEFVRFISVDSCVLSGDCYNFKIEAIKKG